MFNLLPSPPEAKNYPVGENLTQFTVEVCADSRFPTNFTILHALEEANFSA